MTKLILILMLLYAPTIMANNAHDFEFDQLTGGSKIKLADYKNKLIIVVNTASLCKFTPQYQEFEQLWQKYQERGLVIIAVPTNNFGAQEPGSNQEINNFCRSNFNISYLITAKVEANGKNAHPFFNWTQEKFGKLSGPKWNFYKYIIGKDGEPIEWFSSLTSPVSQKIIDIIEKNLPQPVIN